jgi:zinc protease
VIGWMNQVAKLTRADALDFYAAHYQPGNAIVIVAGDVTVDEVRGLADKYYAPLKNQRPVVPRVRIEEPDPVAERRVTMRDARASTPVWQRRYLTKSAGQLPRREELAISLLAEILGAENDGRFYKSLTLDKKLTAFAGAWFNEDQLDYGTFVLYAAPNSGADLGEIEKAIDAEIALVRDKGVTQEELDRTRNRMTAQATYLLDSQQSLAQIFGIALTTGQSIDGIKTWERDLASVTLADIQKAADTVFDLRASVTGILLPEQGN